MTRMNLAGPCWSRFFVVAGRSLFVIKHNICRVFSHVSTPTWNKHEKIKHIQTSTRVFRHCNELWHLQTCFFKHTALPCGWAFSHWKLLCRILRPCGKKGVVHQKLNGSTHLVLFESWNHVRVGHPNIKLQFRKIYTTFFGWIWGHRMNTRRVTQNM